MHNLHLIEYRMFRILFAALLNPIVLAVILLWWKRDFASGILMTHHWVWYEGEIIALIYSCNNPLTNIMMSDENSTIICKMNVKFRNQLWWDIGFALLWVHDLRRETSLPVLHLNQLSFLPFCWQVICTLWKDAQNTILKTERSNFRISDGQFFNTIRSIAY